MKSQGKRGSLSPDIPTSVFERLRRLAQQSARVAYSPYSNFRVGAAVLTQDGRMFGGCNVENASFGLTVCAERNAVFQAVAAGERKILGVLVLGSGSQPTPPCGACRQVIAEFGPKSWVLSLSPSGRQQIWDIRELLPDSLRPKHIRSQ